MLELRLFYSISDEEEKMVFQKTMLYFKYGEVT